MTVPPESTPGPADARLRHAPVPDRLAVLLADHDDPVYLVGGAVRDALLGRTAHDLDFAVRAGATRLAFRVADALGLPAFAMDRERDVARVVLPDGGTYDFAAFRGPSIDADLRARDFTVNAMALPAAIGAHPTLIDPLGGRADLAARRLRLAYAGALVDDPLRALRGVRLGHQLGLVPVPDTEAAMAAAGPSLGSVAPERIRDELLHLAAAADPAGAFRRLSAAGLLRPTLPELAALEGVAQDPPHHEPVLAHTWRILHWLEAIELTLLGSAAPPADRFAAEIDEVAQALAGFAPSLGARLAQRVAGGLDGRQLLRWGALWHDAGKAVTRTVELDGRVRFLGHAEAGARLAGGRLRQLRFGNEAIGHLRALVAGHMRPLFLANEPAVSRRAIFRFFRATEPAGPDIALLALADHLATYDGPGDHPSAGRPAWVRLLAVSHALLDAYFTAFAETVRPTPLVDGRRLMRDLGIPAGPTIGRLLRLIEESQAAGEITTAAEALALARAAYEAG